MNWFTKLERWLQIVIVIAVILAIYFIYRWLKNMANASNYNAAVNQSVTALHELAAHGIKPSYGQAQYTSWANNLQGVFEGCSAAGSSTAFWETVEPIFKAMKNDADVYALIAAYGVRTIDKCGLFTGDFEGDLAATLSEKFSGIEGTIIKYNTSDINAILKSNGLTFTF